MTPSQAKSTIRLGGMTIEFLLEPGDTAGAVSLFRCDLPGGSRVPAPHSHDAFDETAYGLEGTTTFTVGGITTDVGPGRPCSSRAASSTASRSATRTGRACSPRPPGRSAGRPII